MIEPIALLQKLIAFKSITPQDDSSLDFIAHLLSERGFTVHLKTFGPDKVKNLYAVYSHPDTASFNLCFAGHVDVVPPGVGWTSDPFKAVCKDGKIYGRGAVDMKGALSCMIAAALNFLKDHKGTISFLITADEEGDAAYGTKAMLEWMGEAGHKIDFAIVGEPTSEKVLGDKIKIGRRGSINFILEVEGLQGHVAYPHLSVNPNTLMVRILNDITCLKFDYGNDVFMPSNLEITSIDVGNTTSNVIPSRASARFNIRYNNERTEEELVSLIESVISRHTQSYSLNFRSNAKPFLSRESGVTKVFSSSVKQITNVTPMYATDGGTSDARFLQNYCPVLEFGLLSDLAHKIDEHVEIGDLQKLYDVYYHALCSVYTAQK